LAVDVEITGVGVEQPGDGEAVPQIVVMPMSA
jgi:hypothetical protein